MIKILFICHGNICRSTMCEFMMKSMVKYRKIDDKFYIESAATSREEIGNDTHRGTKAKLDEVGVPYEPRRARQVTKEEYEKFDYLIVMDDENLRGLRRIIGEDSDNKVYKLLEFAGKTRDVADPWYTGDFDTTYDDVLLGLSGLLNKLKDEI